MTDIEIPTRHVQTIELELRGPDGQIKRRDTFTQEVTNGNSD